MRLDLATLQRLIEDGVPEDRQLEYKRELKLNTKEQKREFLADVSAFANADGGHLIVGIAEQNGVPIETGGIPRTGSNDETSQRIQNLVRDGVEPNIHGINIKSVEVKGDKVLLVIHIPQSLSKPHWVSLGGHRKFYSRNSNGKYLLDIPELRQMFTLSETAAERIKNFRAERIAAIVEGAIPVQLKQGPKLVLHVVPYSTASTDRQFDLSTLRHMHKDGRMRRFFELSYNFEGLYMGSHAREGIHYFQVFRNGTLEFVTCLLPHFENEIYAPGIGRGVSESFMPPILEWHDTLDVSPPMIYLLSILNVRGQQMTRRQGGNVHSGSSDLSVIRPITDKNHLLATEVLIDALERDPAKLMRHLRPALDAVWQASGWPEAKGFDKEGNWVGIRT